MGSKLVPEVSPRPELHCEALRKIFRPHSGRAIAPERAFHTIFTPLFEPLVAEGILRKWLRGAPGHCSSLCNRFRGFSRRLRILKLWGHQWVGCENLRMHGSQLLLWAASQFFSKMLTYKRAYWVWKLSLCARAPDCNYDISCFPIGPKAKGDSDCTRFLRLWSLLNFARG